MIVTDLVTIFFAQFVNFILGLVQTLFGQVLGSL